MGQNQEVAELETVPAWKLRDGDRVMAPTSELVTVTSTRRSRRADDRHDQWVTLVLDNGHEVELHDGDLIDRVV